MGKGYQGQNLAPDVLHLIDQLERHCLAPDRSNISKSAYFDLQQAREEMSRERLRYLEAMAVYSEAIAMVEEYQQAANLGGNITGIYPQLGLQCSPLVIGFKDNTEEVYAPYEQRKLETLDSILWLLYPK